MPGIKIQKFSGKAPRMAPEHLADTAAQEATNVKLYSGDLIPYPAPVLIGSTGLTGATPQTLHALRNPSTGALVWLVWNKDVDIATPSGTNDLDAQRFYYSGDGAPKVSTYALATSGAAPYPFDYYDLGLPLPTLKPVTTAAPFNTMAAAVFARDVNGVVTLTTARAPKEITGITRASQAVVTAPAHGFTTGDTVAIRNVSGMVEINNLSSVITVLTTNTFRMDSINSTGFTTYTAGGLAFRLGAEAHGLKPGAFVTVTGFTTLQGTYNQPGTPTITVTIVDHNLVVGSRVLLQFVGGTAPSGVYTIVSTPTADTFTITSGTAVSTSGGVFLDLSSLNATSIEVDTPTATTITYTSPGFEVTDTASVDARINLAGPTQARSYLYTWFTPWEEESIGSEPSEPLFLKEGQTVTVSSLPTAPPAGKNFIRGLRLYRTVATTGTGEYLRLATLWFPVTVTTVVGTTVTTAQPHNLAVGGYFKISTGVSGGRVISVLDDFRFIYTGGTGSGGSGGTLYHDVSEVPGDTPPRYWGDGSFNFIDDFSITSLLNVLQSDFYDPPPAGLKGLIEYNTFLVGFDGNEIYFSEPGRYHAWPRSYKREVPHPIVGLATFSGYLLVVTDSYPYLISGSDPAILSVTRIDARYPCLNKRGIANMGFGVMYPTHDGLALYSTTTGPQLATRVLYNSDTWTEDLDPSTLIGTAYKDAYLAWHDNGGISFERDDRVGGFFVDLTTANKPLATWYDSTTNRLYYAAGTTGDIYLWDDLGAAPQTYTWKSKVLVTPNPINIGAGQIDADFTTTEGVVFQLYVAEELVYSNTITSRAVFRLPRGYKSDTFEVRVLGKVRLRAIRLAETPAGLREV